MLNELLKKIKTKDSTLLKLNELKNQKNEIETKVNKQRKILRKENDDVETLEYMNLSSFFYYLTGTKEKKLSKEKEEAYQAKLKYDSLTYQFNSIQKDILYFENILKEIEKCEIQYHELFHEKLNQIKPINPYVEQIENDLITSQNKRIEIEEALHVGDIALKTTNKIIKKLEKAENWSKYDLIGGSGFTHLNKYSNLDDAQNLMNELQTQLSRFKVELTDVNIEFEVKIEIEAFLRMADYWFDNVFTDYTVLDRVKKAVEHMNTTKNSIMNVLSHLKELYTNEKNKESQLKNKLEKIVLES